jgi:hypothetical protein
MYFNSENCEPSVSTVRPPPKCTSGLGRWGRAKGGEHRLRCVDHVGDQALADHERTRSYRSDFLEVQRGNDQAPPCRGSRTVRADLAGKAPAQGPFSDLCRGYLNESVRILSQPQVARRPPPATRSVPPTTEATSRGQLFIVIPLQGTAAVDRVVGDDRLDEVGHARLVDVRGDRSSFVPGARADDAKLE